MRDLLKRLQGTLPVRLLMAYGSSQGSNYASVVAFNAFMTMFPLILGVLTIVGLIFGGEQTAVKQAIEGAFPNGSEIDSGLTGLHNHAGLFGVVSLAGLLWTGTNFFGSLEFALDEIYGVPTRNMVRQRLMGLGMIFIFVAAVLVSVGANTVVAFIKFVPFIGFLVGAAVMMLLLIVIYKVVPNRQQTWREVLPGALTSGALIQVLTLVWTPYAQLQHNFNSYGTTFTAFFVLATWLYLMSSLILLGGVLNRLLRREPVPKAESVAARPGAQDADRRRVEVEPARRPRPET